METAARVAALGHLRARQMPPSPNSRSKHKGDGKLFSEESKKIPNIGGAADINLSLDYEELEKFDLKEVTALLESQFPDKPYAKLFREHEISGEDFVTMSREDFRALGITHFKDIRKMELLIQDKDGKVDGKIEDISKSNKDQGIRISHWKIEKSKDGRFYLTWEPMEIQGDAPEEMKKILAAGTSAPVVMYDNFNDKLRDKDGVLFSVEDQDHDPSQTTAEFRHIETAMKNSGIEVIGRAEAYLAMSIEILEIDCQGEGFTVNVKTDIFWYEPTIINDRKAKPISEHFNDLGELPVELKASTEDLPVDPNNLFGHTVESSVVFSEDQAFFNPVTGVAHVYYKHSATIEEQMELQRFPFDRQLLHVRVLCNIGDYSFLKNPPKAWCIPKKLSSRCINFVPRPRVSSEYQLSKHPQEANLEGEKGELIFKTRVQRYSTYYFFNVIFPLFVISALGSSVFLLDAENLEGRINLVLVLLLTTIAFKFSIDASLPTLSYLTFIDIYLGNTIFILILVAVESIAVRDQSEESADRVDEPLAAAFIVIWAAIHAVFLLLVWTGHIYQSWDQVDEENAEDDNDGENDDEYIKEMKQIIRARQKTQYSRLEPGDDLTKPLHENLDGTMVGSTLDGKSVANDKSNHLMPPGQ